jgi:putative membrane protein
MVLHLGLIVLAAPLLAYGIAPLLRPLVEFRSALSWGALAALFDMVVVWGWHIPLLHALSARYDAIFVLQQLSFLAAGLAVWIVAFNARSRAAAGVAALVLFLTFTHMSMFGLVITLAPRLLYDPSFCLGAFGLSSLEDQRLGGILMAVCGGLPYLAGAAAVLWRVLEFERAG